MCVQGMLVKGGVSLITRGAGQTVLLEPYLYAKDPDYPDKTYEGMEFRWFCRKLSETYPMDDSVDPPVLLYQSKLRNYKTLVVIFFMITDGSFIPENKLTDDQLTANEEEVGSENFQEGGCFGRGPGTWLR